MGDNFIDPAMLAASVDLHSLAVDELMLVLDEVRLLFADVLRVLFDIEQDPSLVAISIKEIELTWDVSCKNALWAPKLWWLSWRDSFLNVSTGRGPHLADLPTVHQSLGLSTKTLQSMSGSLVLHGQRAKNERFKLYCKHEHVLRYEATYDGERARVRLGAPIRVNDRRDLDEDLTRLARLAYEPLLSVRQDLLNQDEFNPSDVWVALAEAGRKPRKTQVVFDTFFAGNVFHNQNERYSRELTKLKRAGMVRLVGRGLWAPTGRLRHYLSKIHLVWTHPDSDGAPTGTRTGRNARPSVVAGVRGVSNIETPPHPRTSVTRSAPPPRTRALRAVSAPSPGDKDAA